MDLWHDSHAYFTYAHTLQEYGIYSHYNDQNNGEFQYSGLFEDSQDKNPRKWRLRVSDTPPPPDNFISPGYPLFISIFLSGIQKNIDYQSVKPALYNIKFAQAILSTLTVLITFFIARLLLGNALALIPMLIVALAPHLIIANLYILTESLFCLILSLIILLIGWSHGRTPRYHILVGALIGIGCLIKPAFLYFILPLCLLYALQIQDKLRKSFLYMLFFGFFITYSPWVIRNQTIPEIPGSPNLMAKTLLAGAYPDLMYKDDPRTYPYPNHFDPEYKRNSQNTSTALVEIWHRFQHSPTQLIKWYLIGKPHLLWEWEIKHGVGGAFVYPINDNPYNSSRIYRLTYEFSKAIHGFLVALGLIGCVLAWLPARIISLSDKKAFVFRVISTTLLYFTFVHAVTFADARYAVPLRPLLAVMALLPFLYLHILFKKIRGTLRV